LKERCEGALFVEMLSRPKAVVEVAEESVEQVALGGGVPVAVFASAPVVRGGPGRCLLAKAQRKRAFMRRLFLTKRRPTKRFLPEARVMEAERCAPLHRGEAYRMGSVRSTAPVRTGLVRWCGQGCRATTFSTTAWACATCSSRSGCRAWTTCVGVSARTWLTKCALVRAIPGFVSGSGQGLSMVLGSA
jgi:hypothetical protein